MKRSQNKVRVKYFVAWSVQNVETPLHLPHLVKIGPRFLVHKRGGDFLSVAALHSREVSHISESPRSVSGSPVPISFVLNSPVSPDRFVSPDRSVSLNNRSVSPNNRSVSPSHRSISPVSSVSPDRSASLSSQGRGVRGQRVR